MDEKLKILVEAGLKVALTERTMAQLEKLDIEDVKALAKACKKLTDPKSRRFLVYSEWSSEQPPGTTY